MSELLAALPGIFSSSPPVYRLPAMEISVVTNDDCVGISSAALELTIHQFNQAFAQVVINGQKQKQRDTVHG